ncbi:MAG: hypothetical protein LBQ84_09505 [Flavobacteriaceae bacterium]|jgi:hypothetical protein|nr:hypothetical protein [Flavobacteriaceae bacterium]
MKKIILISLISNFVLAQTKHDLEGLWIIDEIIGLYTVDEYNLSKVSEQDASKGWVYGKSITFSDGTFNSHYSAECGNDCFPSSKGTFKMVNNTHIQLKLKLVEIRGGCPHSRDSNHRDLGIFLIKKLENGYRLIRSSSTESDIQQEKYSEILNNLPQISGGGSGLNWIELDYLTREKEDSEILKIGLKNIPNFDPQKAQLVYTKYLHYDNKGFVFKYENKILVAIYAVGASVFALYDKEEFCLNTKDVEKLILSSKL